MRAGRLTAEVGSAAVPGFEQRYGAAYGVDRVGVRTSTGAAVIEPPETPMYAYDFVNLLAAALTKAGSTDPAKVPRALEEVTVEGANGDERGVQPLESRRRRRRRRVLRALPRYDVFTRQGRPSLRDASDDPADAVMRVLPAAIVAALACAGTARAEQHIALPSPIAPLSAQPPLAGGARTSAENVAHSVSASTTVTVAIDDAGTPFAVTATQRLDVRGLGDYFFTIGAPVLTVRAPGDSASVPGMRTGSIVWAGFNPGERLLVARATLEPAKVLAALPLRVRIHGGTVMLENTTSVTVGAFTADAPRAPLLAYLARLRGEVSHGQAPLQTAVAVTSTPTNVRLTVAAPLHVTGTIGNQRIDLVLTGRTRIRGSGRIDLRAEPIERVDAVTAASGRALLRAGDSGDAHTRPRAPIRRVPRESRSGRLQPNALRRTGREPAPCRADRGSRTPPSDMGRDGARRRPRSPQRSRPAPRSGSRS